MNYMLRSSSTKPSARSWTRLSSTWPLLRGSWGAALCPSSSDVCLLTVMPLLLCASRSSSSLPSGLIFLASVHCVYDCATEIKTGSPHQDNLSFPFPPLAAFEPQLWCPWSWLQQKVGGSDEELISKRKLGPRRGENKSLFGMSCNIYIR